MKIGDYIVKNELSDSSVQFTEQQIEGFCNTPELATGEDPLSKTAIMAVQIIRQLQGGKAT